MPSSRNILFLESYIDLQNEDIQGLVCGVCNGAVSSCIGLLHTHTSKTMLRDPSLDVEKYAVIMKNMQWRDNEKYKKPEDISLVQ